MARENGPLGVHPLVLTFRGLNWSPRSSFVTSNCTFKVWTVRTFQPGASSSVNMCSRGWSANFRTYSMQSEMVASRYSQTLAWSSCHESGRTHQVSPGYSLGCFNHHLALPRALEMIDRMAPPRQPKRMSGCSVSTRKARFAIPIADFNFAI